MSVVLPLAVTWVSGAALVFLDGRRTWVTVLAMLALAGNLVTLMPLLDAPVAQVLAGGWPEGLGIRLTSDPLGVMFALMAGLVLLGALAFEFARGISWPRLPAVIVLLACGLDGLFLTADAFNFYVFFEITMLSSLALTAYGPDRARFREALLFAFVNAVGSVFFLGSVAALYRMTGTLDMQGIERALAGAPVGTALPVAALLLVAFALKLGIVPFHFWVPGVYVGATTGIAAVLGGAVSSVGTYGLLRFGAGLLPQDVALAREALQALGGVSVLYGALLALGRTRPAAVLAYTAVSQAGYVLVALSVGGPAGYAAAALVGVVNALDKGLLFLAAGLPGRVGRVSVLLGALSAAGLPPGVGFFSKYALLRAAGTAEAWWVVLLVVAGGGLGLSAMIRLHQACAWDTRRRAPVTRGPLARLVVAALAAATVALAVWPEPLLVWGERVGMRLGAP